MLNTPRIILISAFIGGGLIFLMAVPWNLELEMSIPVGISVFLVFAIALHIEPRKIGSVSKRRAASRTVGQTEPMATLHETKERFKSNPRGIWSSYTGHTLGEEWVFNTDGTGKVTQFLPTSWHSYRFYWKCDEPYKLLISEPHEVVDSSGEIEAIESDDSENTDAANWHELHFEFKRIDGNIYMQERGWKTADRGDSYLPVMGPVWLIEEATV